MHKYSFSVEGDAIKVYVRVRPPSEGTALTDGDQGLCLSVLSSNTIRLHSKPEPKIFTFDYVANMETTQESVFSSVAKSIVESCMNGPSDSDNFTHSLRGVIPRSFEYLFFLIEREKEKAGSGKSFLCKCSFIEIYNEQIFDLLDSASAGLFLREHIKKGVFVDGAVEQVLSSAAEAYQVLTMGWRNRRVASTSMNRESSRSHAVFTITVESMEKNNDIVNIRSSLLNLVDLAGSERQKDTHTEGLRLKEAGNINRSLSCLGQVITALVDVGNGKQRHICYRDSKLTFLLRDSLGGNAKTCIIANVHPGSRCFGETLSTLNFAQRAVVNEDTQGNVSQLQAEVKKLKEQLAQLTSVPSMHDISVSQGKKKNTNYINNFIEAMLFWEKSECEKKNLLERIAQLEDLCAKKEKFIQSNKMIVKFREDHIVRLERLHKEAGGSLLPKEQEDLLSELREELQTLREQMEQHPRIAKYAMENHNLREENKRLRSLQSVKKAQEVDAQTIAELEKAFLQASATEKNTGGQHVYSSTILAEGNSLASVEKLKARLLQTQSELASSKQEYEEFKELTKKKHMELESELQSLQKANQHLENILEATKAHKRREVSQLHKLHRETLKNITTPTKAYQLRSRLVPRISPEISDFHSEDLECCKEMMDDIFKEPVPPEMNEQAYEAIAEELKMAQEQLSTMQTKLDEEESKNIKLQQHINKLEHHSAQIQELLSSERNDWSKEREELLEQIKLLEKQFQDAQSKADILKSEVHDLRIVLQSADKELSAVKLEYRAFREKQEKEMSQLSDRHMDVQFKLDSVRLEYEKNLEEKASLQDDYDNLQEVTKFETDQLKQQLEDRQQETEAMKTELCNLLKLLEAEKEHNQKLRLQLQEDKENSKELLKVLEKAQVEKPSSEMLTRCEQQDEKLQKLEQELAAAEEIIVSLKKTNDADKEVVTDLMRQIQELRSSINHKTESIDGLTRELEDINCKYNFVLAAKEESKGIIEDQEKKIEELREALERRQMADNVERDLLCEELHHTSDQLIRLTEASKKHDALLQCAQQDITEKEALIQELREQLDKMTEELEKRKSEYEFKMKQIDSFFVDSSTVTFPQCPKTPPNFDVNLAKILETHEQEIADRRASTITLEHLVHELNEERRAKNDEILRLKEQLNELESLRLEMQILVENNRNLQSQLTEAQKLSKNSDQKHTDVQQLQEKEEEIAEERRAKVSLEETKNTLRIRENTCLEMTLEMERTRALELKAFHEKEEIRSKLEETYEERDRIGKEIDMLRKQVDSLAEENGKLLGHQNVNQKIQYLVKLKKDYTKLTEETEKLRAENAFLKETKRCDVCRHHDQL
uniref:Kinesin family member 15 n=1 Tax=Meleagris gallopavo TaxID=9103 RepID=G1NGN4_MELGA